MWRRRISTGTRWACTLISVVIVAVWVGSLRWGVVWDGARPQRDFILRLQGGAITTYSAGHFTYTHYPSMQFEGITMERLEERDRLQRYWVPKCSRNALSTFVALPLYLPLALTLAPAAWLWRGEVRRRRLAKAGHCGGCGYDRRGLVGVATACPECGAVPHGDA